MGSGKSKRLESRKVEKKAFGWINHLGRWAVIDT
jgi:hypothetical protein